jgi:hypothetical protein
MFLCQYLFKTSYNVLTTLSIYIPVNPVVPSNSNSSSLAPVGAIIPAVESTLYPYPFRAIQNIIRVRSSAPGGFAAKKSFSSNPKSKIELSAFIRTTIFQVLVFSAWFFTAIVVTSLLSMANGSKKFGEYFVLVAAKGRARKSVDFLHLCFVQSAEAYLLHNRGRLSISPPASAP